MKMFFIMLTNTVYCDKDNPNRENYKMSKLIFICFLSESPILDSIICPQDNYFSTYSFIGENDYLNSGSPPFYNKCTIVIFFSFITSH